MGFSIIMFALLTSTVSGIFALSPATNIFLLFLITGMFPLSPESGIFPLFPVNKGNNKITEL